MQSHRYITDQALCLENAYTVRACARHVYSSRVRIHSHAQRFGVQRNHAAKLRARCRQYGKIVAARIGNERLALLTDGNVHRLQADRDCGNQSQGFAVDH